MAHRGRGFQKKIDTVHWTVGVGFQSIAQTVGIVAANVLTAQHLPETLLRIRGEWGADFAGALVAAIGVRVHIGMILVPEGTGSTVLWSPLTDGDAPWIWWDVMHLSYQEQVTDVVVSSQVSSGRRVIDSKAMRKIRNTELQVVVERETITGLTTGTTDVYSQVRALAGS